MAHPLAYKNSNQLISANLSSDTHSAFHARAVCFLRFPVQEEEASKALSSIPDITSGALITDENCALSKNERG